MNRTVAIQAFSLVAILIGVLISYYPPTDNPEAIFTLIGSFLGYGIRDLFGADKPADVPPPQVAALNPTSTESTTVV